MVLIRGFWFCTAFDFGTGIDPSMGFRYVVERCRTSLVSLFCLWNFCELHPFSESQDEQLRRILQDPWRAEVFASRKGMKTFPAWVCFGHNAWVLWVIFLNWLVGFLISFGNPFPSMEMLPSWWIRNPDQMILSIKCWRASTACRCLDFYIVFLTSAKGHVVTALERSSRAVWLNK